MSLDSTAELVALWRALSPADRENTLELLAEDEAVALELALGPDDRAVKAARADTTDPVAFVRRNLPELMPLDPAPHHDELLGALDPSGPTGVRMVAGAPRGAGKSTTALTALPVVAAIRRSHRFVVVIRDNLPDAITSVTGIRTLLESHPELLDRYPWVRPLPGQAGELHLAGGVIILARSTGSAIRGLNRVLPDGTVVRPDLVVGDDLEDDESARSTLQTGRLADWLKGTIGQLGGPPGSSDAGPLDLVVVGTTLETNALVSKMLDGRDGFEAWSRRRFPAEGRVELVDGTLEVVDVSGVPTAIPLPPGAGPGDRVPLWPEGMPLEYLDRLSDPTDPLFVGSIVYSREYLLRPRQRTDTLFGASRTVWLPDLAQRWLAGDLKVDRPGLGVDPAVSSKETADYTSLAVAGLAKAGDAYGPDRCEELEVDPTRTVLVVPYVERRRATPAETLAWIEDTAAAWIPTGRVTFEAEGGFAWAADELRRRASVSVRPVASQGADKRTRATPLSVWHEAHRVAIDSRLKAGPFDAELHGFTGTGQEEHDDQVDALVWTAMYATNAWRTR